MHLTFNFQNNFFSMKDKKAFIKFHYTLVLFFCLPACTILFQYLMMNEKLFFSFYLLKTRYEPKKLGWNSTKGPHYNTVRQKPCTHSKASFLFSLSFLSLYFSFVLFCYLFPSVFFGFCPFFCLTLHLYLFKSSTNEALYLSLSLFSITFLQNFLIFGHILLLFSSLISSSC